MSEWKEVRLDSLVNRKICYGIVQPGISPESGIPVIKVNNIVKGLRDVSECDKTTEVINNKYKRTILKGGELVMSLVGTVGYVDIVPLSFAGANLVRATGMIDIEDELIKRWVLFYIRTKQGQQYIEDHLNTTVQRALNIKDLCKMPIPITQRFYMEKVVSILSSLDDKIAVNRKICENLEAQAQALFKHWFVDFAPFKDGKFVESELGLIPEGWRVGTFGEIMSITSGKRPPKKENCISGEFQIPLIGASDIMGYTNTHLYNEKILVTGRVGTHGIVQRYDYPCWPSDNMLVLKSSFYEFCYQVLRSIDYKSLNRGSTQPLISQSDIKNYLIVIPTKEILSGFEILISPLMELWKHQHKECSNLATLRDTLLPKLMSGQIKV